MLKYVCHHTQLADTTPSITMAKSVLKSFLEMAVHGFFQGSNDSIPDYRTSNCAGFLPAVERRRRSVEGEDRSHVDLVATVLGALVGRQDCSRVLACRWGGG